MASLGFFLSVTVMSTSGAYLLLLFFGCIAAVLGAWLGVAVGFLTASIARRRVVRDLSYVADAILGGAGLAGGLFAVGPLESGLGFRSETLTWLPITMTLASIVMYERRRFFSNWHR